MGLPQVDTQTTITTAFGLNPTTKKTFDVGEVPKVSLKD
jgi:hypothetical protein